jgi:hypothetical protein
LLSKSIFAGCAWLACSAALAQAPDYLKQIKPLLKQRCYACHGGLKQESDLRLDTVANMRKGGGSGPAIVPGNATESLVFKAISGHEDVSKMPPEGQAVPLAAEQIAVIAAWINAGAPGPDQEQPEADPRAHWAFRRPVRPAPPTTLLRSVANQSIANPIDAFIAAEWEKHGIRPLEAAPPEVQLRRVYLDLVGVPPSREELNTFLADPSDEAYLRIVDRLLDDPQYGERWARHWMDVWRYADWYGRRSVPDWWNSACQNWRWRDWIVDSLNADRGYDQMVQEMLAGDELAGDDPERAVATGYLARNWYALNYNSWIRDNIEHTAKAFLGLTFNCAHCHDHKYDPISNEDYFRFRAFFEPIEMRQDRWAGEPDPGPFQKYEYGKLRKVIVHGAIRVFDDRRDAPTFMYAGGDERNKLTDRGPVAPGIPAFLDDGEFVVQPIDLPPRAWYPGLQPGIQETMLADARAALAAAVAATSAARQQGTEPTPEAKMQLAQAEAAYEKVRQESTVASKALSGVQSLRMDATGGRRCLQNRLTELKKRLADSKSLPEGTVLSFQVKIVKDAHVNFQFAKDINASLTAGYLGFVNGRIVSYQPGSFTEFDAGRYDFATGQDRFQVRLVIETQHDRCLLFVRSLNDDKPLVEAVPVALNGWNPIGDPAKAISLDARTGVVAVIDDLTLTAPGADGSAPLFQTDFEPPLFPEGEDAAGKAGWEPSPYSVAPATSVVTSKPAGNDALLAAEQKLAVARRVAELPALRVRVAEAREQVARAALDSLAARIDAERARYGESPDADPSALARAAGQAERIAALRQAEVDLLAQQTTLAESEAKPESDANRVKEIDAAQAAISAFRTAVEKASAALADESLSETYAPLTPTYPPKSTGRRAALARWIASENNPLTARVAVNHLWLRHFGQALVDSVFDFGRNGKPPSHPELLDWLAVEFMESGWKQKQLHRLIVTSRMYRQTSATSGEAAAHDQQLDPDNKLYWRFPPRRLEAEAVRDSLLSVAGALDRTIGGKELEVDQDGKTFRRTLYYSCHPEDGGRLALLENFDVPDPCDCYRRSESVLPQQALALTNSDLARSLSRQLSQQLWDANVTGTAAAEVRTTLIRSAFEQGLARRPTDEELAVAEAFWTDLSKSLIASGSEPAAADRAAFESLVHALLNHHDFVTIR